jgi:hypothetical protein
VYGNAFVDARKRKSPLCMTAKTKAILDAYTTAHERANGTTPKLTMRGTSWVQVNQTPPVKLLTLKLATGVLTRRADDARDRALLDGIMRIVAA